MRILMLQHYKSWRPGQTYTVEDWTGQQLIELHKAAAIKDMSADQITVKRGPGRPRKNVDGITG